MLRKPGWIAAFGLLGVLAVAACDDNPLSEGREDVDRFRINPSFAFVKVNDSTKVSAIALNRHGEPTGDAVTATACDAKISVVRDETRVEYEPPERFVVRGVAEGETCVNVAAGGQQATITINVVP
jgi:hypothetical protein